LDRLLIGLIGLIGIGFSVRSRCATALLDRSELGTRRDRRKSQVVMVLVAMVHLALWPFLGPVKIGTIGALVPLADVAHTRIDDILLIDSLVAQSSRIRADGGAVDGGIFTDGAVRTGTGDRDCEWRKLRR
jgi:hypothetical protein